MANKLDNMSQDIDDIKETIADLNRTAENLDSTTHEIQFTADGVFTNRAPHPAYITTGTADWIRTFS